MNQGQKANSVGKEAEDIIAGILARKGCRVERQANIGLSIYDMPLAVDFKVHGLSEYPKGLIIECKWQSASGSVDEKFPYLILNIKQSFGGLPTIVVLSGGGCKSGAECWLRYQVGDNLIAVMNLEEFVNWITDLDATGRIVRQTLW
jgi:hypothetical protein